MLMEVHSLLQPISLPAVATVTALVTSISRDQTVSGYPSRGKAVGTGRFGTTFLALVSDFDRAGSQERNHVSGIRRQSADDIGKLVQSAVGKTDVFN